MPRPPAKRATASAKKSSRIRQAANQVALDAEQVRVDLDKLLKSLEDLGVEALKEVSDRALALIAEKSQTRTLIQEVAARAIGIGESITGMFGGSDKPKRERRVRATKAS